jgi:hypothetical protein
MKLGNVATQIEQRMHLHRRLGGAKQRPGKQRQTQIYGGRIQRVTGVLQFDAEAVACIQGARLRYQALGELCVNTPIPCLVGIGKRRAFDIVTKPHVIALGGLRRQAHLDIAQTFAVGQLSKRHCAKLIGTVQRLHVTVAAMSRHDSGKRAPRQKIHQLREQRLANVHRRLRGNYPRKSPGTAFCLSNRHHFF